MTNKYFCPKCGGWSRYNFDVISGHENWRQEVVKCRTCKWIGTWSEVKKIASNQIKIINSKGEQYYENSNR